MGILWSRPLDGSYRRSARCFGGCGLRRPWAMCFFSSFTEIWNRYKPMRSFRGEFFWLTMVWQKMKNVQGILVNIWKDFVWFVWCFFSPASGSNALLQVNLFHKHHSSPLDPNVWHGCHPSPKTILRTYCSTLEALMSRGLMLSLENAKACWNNKDQKKSSKLKTPIFFLVISYPLYQSLTCIKVQVPAGYKLPTLSPEACLP